MNLTRLVLAVAALVQLAGAGMLDQRLVSDSLRDVEPWQRRQWLAERGLQDYYKAQSWRPTADSGLRCVGRWSYGPSVKVSIRATADDTIVCLARGSGASIIRFRSQDSLTLDLLSDINCNGIVSRAIIDDTLVYCGMNQGGTGIEVWGVSDLTSPYRLSYVYLPPIMDIAVKDTFLYATGYVQDSLRIFSVADPRNPVQVGACSDFGYPMCVSGDYCYLADQYGLNIVDVSNPASPHRIGGIGGFEALAVAVRDSLCYVGTYDGSNFALRVYDVRDPAIPFPVGSLAGIEVHDIYLPSTCDSVLYTPKLHVINIADPTNPRQIGFVDCPGWDYGVQVVPALSVALVADYADGLVAVDVSSPQVPAIDTLLYAADAAEDIHVDNDRVYVASRDAGLVIVDASDPAHPFALGRCDSVGMSAEMMTATACDSFAFIGWRWPQRFKSVDVHDPGVPEIAGGVQIFNPPKDMVLRDTLIYIAEQGRLQIVNVARSRQPVLVGSCNTQDGTYFGLAVQDSFAYLIAGMLEVINVSQPTNPTIVSRVAVAGSGVAVRDTFVYVPYGYDTLRVYSAANPKQLRLLGIAPLQSFAWDVAVAESVAVVATDKGLEAFSLEDPAHPHWRAAISTPYGPRRVVYEAPHFYTAMLNAGVSVYSAESLGLQEVAGPALPPIRFRALPNPVGVRGLVWLDGVKGEVILRDVSGRVVTAAVIDGNDDRSRSLDLSELASGVYFVEVSSDRKVGSVKVVRR